MCVCVCVCVCVCEGVGQWNNRLSYICNTYTMILLCHIPITADVGDDIGLNVGQGATLMTSGNEIK